MPLPNAAWATTRYNQVSTQGCSERGPPPVRERDVSTVLHQHCRSSRRRTRLSTRHVAESCARSAAVLHVRSPVRSSLGIQLIRSRRVTGIVKRADRAASIEGGRSRLGYGRSGNLEHGIWNLEHTLMAEHEVDAQLAAHRKATAHWNVALHGRTSR